MLNKTEQRILELYQENKTIPEIARIIGKTYAGTKSTIHFIRKRGEPFPRRNKTAANMPIDIPTDVDGDIENGKRCPKCWLLFTDRSDCTPAQCMARTEVISEHLPAIGLLFDRAYEEE